MVKPLLTILMPVYNAEAYIREAIESMLCQTLQDFEFLVIDDGSTDKCAEIVRSYHDERIRLILNGSNLGITATLNKGIALASCELIARMDADDISHPDRLQKQYDYMVRHPGVALLSTWARVIDENKKLIREEPFPPAYYYYNMNFICWIYHSTVMFRRSIVRETGYRSSYSEDFELFWQLMQEHEFYNLPEFLLDYRITKQSLHLVLKKEEYDRAQQQQVKRNIAHYMGKDIVITDEQLQCFRHDFIPLLKKNKVKDIRRALALLKKITDRIATTPGVNCNTVAIQEAGYYKWRFIIIFFARNLYWTKGVWLLISTFSWPLLFEMTRKYLARSLKFKHKTVNYFLHSAMMMQ